MFHVKSVEFLGYIVATNGVTISEHKVEFIKNWKPPRLVKEVQIFIGFANFYRRFIKDFSKFCPPITETLKGDKTKFFWGDKQNRAFEELKTRFMTAPILEHFYPDQETVVETEASDFALACVLSQFKENRLHPVAFHSTRFHNAERSYEIHDKELLAILEEVQRMETLSGWIGQTNNGIHRPPELRELLNNHGLEPATSPLGTKIGRLQLQNYISTRS